MSKIKVAVFCTQYGTVKSGPGRFVQYLRESEFADCELTFFSDQIDQSEGNKIAVPAHPFMRRFPLYWITRNIMFYRSFLPVQDQFDVILCTSALEAMSLIKLHEKIAILIMVNDDNLVNAGHGFWDKVKIQGFGKSSSRYWHRRLEDEVCSKAGLVITNSDFTLREVVKGYDLPPERVTKLYKAVDLSVFSSDHLSPETELPKVLRLLFLKNDFRRGGLDILIDALAQWPAENAFDLTVAGISPQEVATVEKALEKAGPSLRNSSVKSLLNREEISKLYREHNLFINMARQEALGVSCLEAMASGLPVIASDAGGLPEVLANGEAGFMLPLSPDALRECLRGIVANPSVLKEKRVAMKLQVAKFSKMKMISNLNGIIVDVLSK
jgi:glycosyltransferase involved in cell wall biosynthesis